MITSMPLRSIAISNFRRFAGQVDLPLDASVVLIHGSNGSGKTSILSAVELALTGEIQSLARQDPDYPAHMVHYGESAASVSIAVDDSIADATAQGTIAITSAGIDGTPALDSARLQFYQERCYLDQVSLGRLLELYQHTEKNRESSLARFVNELLGLDHLDALIAGLLDATHIAKLKNLAPEYASALKQAEGEKQELDELASKREATVAEIEDRLSQVELAALGLKEAGFDLSSSTGLRRVAEHVSRSMPISDAEPIKGLAQSLAEIRGRIEGASNRPVHSRVHDARERLTNATGEERRWRMDASEPLREVLQKTGPAGLPIELTGRLSATQARNIQIEARHEAERLSMRVAEIKRLREVGRTADQRISNLTADLDDIDEALSSGEKHAGALAAGLAALKDQTLGDLCPVCDRDFSEVSNVGLLAHIVQKIDSLSEQGSALRALAERRGELRDQLSAETRRRDDMSQQLEEHGSLEEAESRFRSMASLLATLEESSAIIAEGLGLEEELDSARNAVAEAEALDEEEHRIRALLQDVAEQLGAEPAVTDGTLMQAWARLTHHVAEASDEAVRQVQARADLLNVLSDAIALNDECDRLSQAITEGEQVLRLTNRRVESVATMRVEAKALRKSASNVRARIVDRVFDESLNRVWRDIFMRLAPDEEFVPAFSRPQAGKHHLSISLETIHRSGGTAGPPGTMLSSGNLNTAALSLFMALHLAIESKLPCLVFDDPIQSMDEVHVSQFAALARMLSKRHERQVMIAVHERELFDYLSLELGPAFDGDEMITIELGSESGARTSVSTNRIRWRQDQAVAG